MKRVLVVEDEKAIRELVAESVAEWTGCRVDVARNGADALLQLHDELPDAIILDLTMPIMDGWAFIDACRRDQRFARIPIIALSAVLKVNDALPRGARVALAKPFDLEVLMAAVEGCLRTDGYSSGPDAPERVL